MNLISAFVGRYLDDQGGSCPVEINQERCSGIIKQCSRPCASVCPTQAILPESSRVDRKNCQGCGSCVSQCPNGAINLVRYTDMDLIKDVADLAPARNVLRFFCQKSKGGRYNEAPDSTLAEIKIGCLARLHPGLILYPFGAGMSRIWLDVSGCQDCPDNQGDLLFTVISNNYSFTNQMLADLCRSDKGLFMDASPPDGFFNGVCTVKHIDRRSFFIAARKELQGYSAKVAAGVSLRLAGVGDENNDPASKTIKGPPLSRSILLAALQRLYQNQLSDEGSFTLSLFTIKKECTLCGICSNCCPTGALKQTKDESGGWGEISFIPAFCIDCKTCQKKCPQSSISPEGKTNLADFLQKRQLSLHVVRLGTCRKCRASYVDSLGTDGCCDICAQKAGYQINKNVERGCIDG